MLHGCHAAARGDRVCRAVAGSGPRILMLTAAVGIDDRVDGLELGADDHLGKPFAFVELVARVRALSRRAPSVPPILRGPGRGPRSAPRQPRGQPAIADPQKFGILEMLLAAVVLFLPGAASPGWSRAVWL